MPLDQILTEVRAMLTEIIGAEYALGLDIGMETSFDADLELESIDQSNVTLCPLTLECTEIELVGDNRGDGNVLRLIPSGALGDGGVLLIEKRDDGIRVEQVLHDRNSFSKSRCSAG